MISACRLGGGGQSSLGAIAGGSEASLKTSHQRSHCEKSYLLRPATLLEVSGLKNVDISLESVGFFVAFFFGGMIEVLGISIRSSF